MKFFVPENVVLIHCYCLVTALLAIVRRILLSIRLIANIDSLLNIAFPSRLDAFKLTQARRNRGDFC